MIIGGQTSSFERALGVEPEDWESVSKFFIVDGRMVPRLPSSGWLSGTAVLNRGGAGDRKLVRFQYPQIITNIMVRNSYKLLAKLFFDKFFDVIGIILVFFNGLFSKLFPHSVITCEGYFLPNHISYINTDIFINIFMHTYIQKYVCVVYMICNCNGEFKVIRRNTQCLDTGSSELLIFKCKLCGKIVYGDLEPKEPDWEGLK